MNYKDKILVERSWKRMRAVLDKEMPVQDVPGGSLNLWYVLGIVACMGLFLAVVSNSRARKSKPSIHELNQPVAQPTEISNDQSKHLSPRSADHAKVSSHTTNSISTGLLPTQPPAQTQHLPTQSRSRQSESVAQSISGQTVFSVLDQQSTTEQPSDQPQTQPAHAAVPVLGHATPNLRVTHLQTVPHLATLQPSEVQIATTLPVLNAPVRRKKSRCNIGAQVAVGSSLLPLPSSVGLSLVGNYRLRNRYALIGGVGIDHIVLNDKVGKLVGTSVDDWHDQGFDSVAITYIAQRSANGDPLRVQSASLKCVHLGLQKQFNTRMSAGLAFKFQSLRSIELGQESNEVIPMNTGHNNLVQTLDNTYDQIATYTFARRALSSQVNLSYSLNSKLRLGLAVQNVLTDRHPEPTSILLTATYLH